MMCSKKKIKNEDYGKTVTQLKEDRKSMLKIVDDKFVEFKEMLKSVKNEDSGSNRAPRKEQRSV